MEESLACKGPSVVRVFLWKACSNILPTKINLHKRGIVEDSLCPICKQEDESVEHILWTCESARDVWAECNSKLQKCATMEVSFANLFMELVDKLDADEMQKVAVIARLIWSRRNNVVFGGDFMSPKHILEAASSQLENFSKAEAGRRMRSTVRPVPEVVQWNKPNPGWIKLNWDAAIDSGNQKMGIGIIARDHTGSVLAAVCASRPHVTEPTTAEAIAAWKLADICSSLGFARVVLEGDSLEVVKALQTEGPCWSRFGLLINDAKILLNSLQEWRVCHVKRMGNKAAHTLAQRGLTVDEDHLWSADFPSFVLDIALSDVVPN
jgi:ribonuclease HI